MKKKICLLLSAVMVLSLAACGQKSEPTPTPDNAETLTGTAKGYGGDVTVTLTRKDGVITACSIEGKDETPTVGGAALPDLEAQVVAANGYNIDGVSGATMTTKGVKAAVAAALGEEYKEETKPVETAGSAPIVEIEGGLQIGMAYAAAHGTKCFTQAHAVVQGDVIIAAYVDDFQFVSADAGLNVVPNSDKEFGEGYAEGKALASKRTVADYYSQNMAEKAGSTVRIDDNFDAIQTFVVGKTIAEVEAAAAKGEAAVDAVTGATLADTAGYLGAIAQAARNAQETHAVEFTGDSANLKLNVAYGAPHGGQSFGVAAALTDGDTIVLSYVDEFQFLDAGEGIVGVPNSTEGFADGYAEGKVLCSKRTVADYYSTIMTNYAGSTVRIDDNYNAIQNHVNGMTVAEAESLSGSENAVDMVSGATLADTAGYVALIVEAAKG